MPMRSLKVRSVIPFHLETRMIQHWGFVISKRIYNYGDGLSYILFTKPYVSDNDDGVKRTIRASVSDHVLPTKISLPAWQVIQLDRRVQNIVNFFHDPYSVPEAVRARLTILQQKLLPGEAEWVQEFMEENFPV